ncbi:MAG: HAD family hydrolase [Desulfococcaceae bacterium]
MGLAAVILDCDGVMFDTTDVNRNYYNRILAEFGRPEMTDEQFRYAHMATADQAVAMLFPDPAERSRADAFRREMTYREFVGYMKEMPELKPLLRRLRPKVRTAVVTNRSDTMPLVLERFELGGLFDRVVTALDVARPKPDPEGLNQVLAAFEITPDLALYVGDTEADQEAAAAAGVPFAAFDNRELKAEYHVANLAEVAELAGV